MPSGESGKDLTLVEANRVRKGEAKTRKELNEGAARLDIRGRSKMGKDELRAAIARAR